MCSCTDSTCSTCSPLTVQPPHLHCCTTMCWISQTFSPTKFRYCTNWSKSSFMKSTTTSYWGASAGFCCLLVIQATPEFMRAYRSAKSWNLVLSGRFHSQPSPKISKSAWKIAHAIQCHSTALACQSAKFTKDVSLGAKLLVIFVDKRFQKNTKTKTYVIIHAPSSVFSMFGEYLIITDSTSRDTRIMTNYQHSCPAGWHKPKVNTPG